MNTNTKFIKDSEEEITEPFKDDLWGRKQLGEKLTHFISNLQCGATIALDAEWGAGKTWFVKNWKTYLSQNGYTVIYIDAFAHDFMEDPFLILSMEILNTVDADQTVIETFKEKFIGAYHAVLPNLPMLIWSLAMTLMGAGYFSKSVQETISAVKDATGEAGEKAGELLEEGLREHLTELVENYNTNKNELKYFKEALGELVRSLDKPLVFIVDELDRCKPEFSIKLIERIKHFFDISNIVFVLATNKSQLEESINSFYGFQSANAYLEKFIDLNIKFPNKTNNDYITVIQTYTTKFNINVNHGDILLLSQVFDLNSRELIKILQKMALLNLNAHTVSSVVAFYYLILEQRKMLPNQLNEKEFLDYFVEKIIEHVAKQPTYGRPSYNFADPILFSKEYAESKWDDNSGLMWLLRIYYSRYTDELLDQYDTSLKKSAYILNSDGTNRDSNFVKSWHDYINSGFLV